ncbi:hypothetical protein MJG53_005205 [Ovis ammon polii x Ovis aries]|uniref:Uncharacterized protein n=1 Tax=Ovis ammon polii x Ovis aries TaxID=2918886 RepID=A0ACB9VC61_9CETA|nr:hypothetical protein MJG53_005205 [Ovis ammon polii x Ovis aries]
MAPFGAGQMDYCLDNPDVFFASPGWFQPIEHGQTASRRCRHWWSRGRRRPPTPNIQALAHSTVGQSLPIPLKKPFPSISSITRPLLFFKYEGNFIQKFQYELSTKRVLNTMIIGAHVLLGQILQNHMLDLLIHNSKLLCILQVIHFPQPLLDDMQEAPIFHVQAAHEKEQITSSSSSAPMLHPRGPGIPGCSSVCGAVRSALSRPSRKCKADPPGDSKTCPAVNWCLWARGGSQPSPVQPLQTCWASSKCGGRRGPFFRNTSCPGWGDGFSPLGRACSAAGGLHFPWHIPISEVKLNVFF